MLRGAFCVAVLLFAGCADTPAATDTGDPAASRVVVSEEGFRLTITVVDEAIRPVAGALVRVDGAGQGLTSEGGSLVFEGLAAGTYFVNVTAPGFLAVRVVVDVAPNTPPSVRILLPRDASYRPPTIETIHFQGFINGTEVLLRRSAGTDTFYSDCTCIVTREHVEGLTGFVVDVVWDDSIGKPVGEPRKFRWLMTTDEVFDWEIRKGASPWTEHVDVGLFEAGNTTTQWEMNFYPEEDWVRFQQSFDVYWTAFAGQPVPPGWTFLET